MRDIIFLNSVNLRSDCLLHFTGKSQCIELGTIITKQSSLIKNLKMADFNLPNEIWCQIFSYLPLEPKKNATATCKLWFSLIRQDPKLSGHILISWHNIETALETLHWNWSNWPALKTLELTKLELVEALFKTTRESTQNVIEKLSLKDNCPASLEEVLFDVDLPHIQTYGQSPLKYKTYTDQFFGLGQELDSIEEWNEFESNIVALQILESMNHPPGGINWEHYKNCPSSTLYKLYHMILKYGYYPTV